MLDHSDNHSDNRTINYSVANVDDVLEALRQNLAEHKEIVAEARLGYINCEHIFEECKADIEKARMNLVNSFAKLDCGDAIPMPTIHFPIPVPTDHSREFGTIIKMLELYKAAHEGNPTNSLKMPATIELKAADVRRFVLNDWQWMDHFLLVNSINSIYSAKSRALADIKGLI